ncbi:hypothetical protein [Chitinophaga sp. Cy-1792]|uniref:hypothetical protein n=1 Tax=Chitinophaga sp. Cy-1792 TaxID=2608339 RepID=UPI00141EA279|nr:hypothetical protein [Chitinophaga sp. Cy-1792]NIG53131.1 hypothetical protein [Chitinophaga sp. Cy-1792]
MNRIKYDFLKQFKYLAKVTKSESESCNPFQVNEHIEPNYTYEGKTYEKQHDLAPSGDERPAFYLQ